MSYMSSSSSIRSPSSSANTERIGKARTVAQFTLAPFGSNKLIVVTATHQHTVKSFIYPLPQAKPQTHAVL
eukprot:m.345675 g.345675  ORF g.345675 m.345675 type:complete len:71 (+) comp16141_c1_seq13:10810-11022(+)